MGVTYRWRGERDPSGHWKEFFGAPDGLPARDLTEAEVASLNDAQRAKLESPAGRRLYQKAEAKPPAPKKAGRGAADSPKTSA